MKISFDWLNQMLPVQSSIEDASAVLTATGLEVEGVESVESIPGGLTGLVAGKILSAKPHPNADRLQICEVHVGEAEPLQIVCGASNARADLSVIVATVGTTLFPIDGEPFKIKKGKIRGEVSMGMICAEDEIGIGKSHAGIIELDSKWAPGTPAAEVFDLQSDWVLEIGLTPNRTDGMSHWGVARDLRAGLLHETVEGKSEQVGSLQRPTTSPWPVALENELAIDVEDAEGCAVYCGMLLENIAIAPSPEWAQRRLRAIGVQPQNNVVDATNFVLHELGQPLHAFDADAIQGNRITVRRARTNEKLTTLDGIERTLHSDDQVIADTQGPMCLAGVYGGEKSGVSDATQRVVLESAYFDPVVTRKMAKRHGLSTDASFRFERGVDPDLIQIALQRAAHLLQEWTGCKIVGVKQVNAGELPTGATIDLEWDQLDRLIGVSLDRSAVREICGNLDVLIQEETATSLTLQIPAYRKDVTRPADVIEEVLRIYGFDKIPLPSRMNSTAQHQAGVPEQPIRLQMANVLVSRGFQEIMSNSMTRASFTEDFGENADGWNPSKRIALLNPLSSDLGVMRQSLLFQGLEAIAHNRNHQRPDLRFFEIGRVYQHRETENAASTNAFERYAEDERIGIWMTGKTNPENWTNAGNASTPYSIKSEAYAMLDGLGIASGSLKESTFQSPLFAEGIELSYQNQSIGRLGLIRKEVGKKCGVNQSVFWADFSVSVLTKLSSRKRVKAQGIAKFPAVRRDLSLILQKGTSFGQLRDCAAKAEKKLLKRVGLFDVYEGDKLAEGEVSYAISLTLQDPERTLNEKQIEQSVQRILNKIAEETGARLRD
jgi:phenylalanyl-tRNA synthetase beta chain